jgi:hypothetical protein
MIPLLRAPQLTRSVAVLVIVVSLFGCAGANRQPDTGAPRSSEEPYPVVYQASKERVEEAKAQWTNFLQEQGVANPPPPDLQPVTATIRDLPADAQVNVLLPKVGTGALMSDDDTRESLRRFIESTRVLIGSAPPQLSLVQTSKGETAPEQAFYQQKPFRYALRNGFGEVRIGFAPDRRILQFSSTCIPNLPGLQRSLGNIKINLTAEQAAEYVTGRSLSFTDSSGTHQFSVSPGEPVDVKQIVVFPLRSPDNSTLNLHLAWEITVGTSPARTVYLDAVKSEVLGMA